MHLGSRTTARQELRKCLSALSIHNASQARSPPEGSSPCPQKLANRPMWISARASPNVGVRVVISRSRKPTARTVTSDEHGVMSLLRTEDDPRVNVSPIPHRSRGANRFFLLSTRSELELRCPAKEGCACLQARGEKVQNCVDILFV
jgi:hypothetical protein